MRDSASTRRREDDFGRASYDEARDVRFGSGGGRFGFGAGGRGLPWVFLWIVVALCVVIGRLFWLQIMQGDWLSERAEAQRTNVIRLVARRGTIYDRNGNILAISEECYDVCCNPEQITEETETETAQLVSAHLGGEIAAYRAIFAQKTTFAYLSKLCDKEVAEELRRDLISSSLEGVYLYAQTRRVYPYGEVAGQIIGLTNHESEGLTGLELQYDSYLKGTDGEMILECGLNGTPIAGGVSEVTKPVRDGQDLFLAIDIDVQRAVEEYVKRGVEAAHATSGFCMVEDPTSGEVIACCSTPYADLSHQDLITNESLALKMISDSYEPGSIAKVLTAAIGLESGTVDANTYYYVPISVMVGDGIVFDVDDRLEEARMNLREVLRRSSNVGAALIAQTSIGAEVFAQGMESFGIGVPTGIDYPGEAAGLVKKLSEYDASTLGSMSFGQGFSVPMVQMVRSVGAIAAGGLMYTPHFATRLGERELTWPEPQRAVSEVTALKVADMMRTVVEEGTAQSAAVPGFDVAAKTGTGEIAGAGGYLKNRYLASLIGFAPAHDPKVLVYVGLNETPHLSYSSAGPVFSAIMGEALSDLGILAQDAKA